MQGVFNKRQKNLTGEVDNTLFQLLIAHIQHILLSRGDVTVVLA